MDLQRVLNAGVDLVTAEVDDVEARHLVAAIAQAPARLGPIGHQANAVECLVDDALLLRGASTGCSRNRRAGDRNGWYRPGSTLGDVTP